MTKKKSDKPYEEGRGKPPKWTQFGQPGGNKPGGGPWKKEDTARHKLEHMMKMSDEEIDDVLHNGLTAFEKSFANIIRLMRTATNIDDATKCMIVLEKMINQVYGRMPEVQITVPADEKTAEEANKFIRGFALP